MRGNICIGCISDTDPQPIMVRSKLGLYAVCSIGIIQNAKALSEELLENGCANFETMSSGNINSGGLIGALIAQKPTLSRHSLCAEQDRGNDVSGHYDRRFDHLRKRQGGQAADPAMTANAFLEDMQKSREAGMDEHLSKPVDIAALEQTVKRFRVIPPKINSGQARFAEEAHKRCK